MIQREDILKAGWETVEAEDDGYPFYYNFPIDEQRVFHMDVYREWVSIRKIIPTNHNIEGKVVVKYEEINVYRGNIPDYNALILLMDWLGIKSIPAEKMYSETYLKHEINYILKDHVLRILDKHWRPAYTDLLESIEKDIKDLIQ